MWLQSFPLVFTMSGSHRTEHRNDPAWTLSVPVSGAWDNQSVLCVPDQWTRLCASFFPSNWSSFSSRLPEIWIWISSLRRAASASTHRGAGVWGAYTSSSSAGGLRGRWGWRRVGCGGVQRPLRRGGPTLGPALVPGERSAFTARSQPTFIKEKSTLK